MRIHSARTLNPLHFEDLEPHRFEDLVRQLAHGFRSWRSIEATGRLGADEGGDIRAVAPFGRDLDPAGNEDDEAVAMPEATDRIWLFQCKRQRMLGPKKVRQVIDEAIPDGAEVPYGFILAAACDFSLKARNIFHQHARARGVQESHMWGKGQGLRTCSFYPHTTTSSSPTLISPCKPGD